MKNKAPTAAIAFTVLSIVVVGSAGCSPTTTTQPPSSQTTSPNRALDWDAEFGTIDWQKSVAEGCREDFQALIAATSTDHESCTPGSIDEQIIRPLTEQEKNLYRFIKTVVDRSAPAGHVLAGGYGDSRSVWVEDLNGDGPVDMALPLISRPSTSASQEAQRPPTRSILLVVTPTSMDGTSKKLAELSRFEEILAIDPAWVITGIDGSLDFDHDGKKELLIPGYGNKPSSVVFRVDYSKGTMSLLHQSANAREMDPVLIGGIGGAWYVSDRFFRDVDKDGIDELVRHDGRLTDDSNQPIKTESLGVFKWNGTFFDYSKAVSEQLKTSFDPSKDIR
jgi:hypothetical protein